MKTTFVVEFDDVPFGVKIEQTSKHRFTITYGQRITCNLSYAEAAKEFGECMFHALACDGKLENGL